MVSTSDDTIIKEIEIAEAVIKLRADGIVHVHYKKNTTLDIELQVRMRKIYNELTNYKKSKFIFSAEEGLIVTREARENARKLQEESPILFYALIASNLAYKIIGNFYIKVVKARGDYKLVSSIKEAVEWLHSMEDPS